MLLEHKQQEKQKRQQLRRLLANLRLQKAAAQEKELQETENEDQYKLWESC